MPSKIEGLENTRACIESYAAAKGISLSTEGAARLASDLAGKLVVSEGKATITDAAGRSRDLLSYLAEMGARQATTHLFGANAGLIDLRRNPWTDGHRNLTRQHQIEMLDSDVADAMRSAAEIANHDDACDPRNPYGRAGWNLTAQYTLENTDPARAAELQAQAGL